MVARARTSSRELPGAPSGDGTTRELDARFVWHPLAEPGSADAGSLRVAVRARGHFVEDDRGRLYLDAMAGLWCVNVGYGRREIADAVLRQMTELPYFPHTWANRPAARLAARLAGLLDASRPTPGGWRVFFVQSGSEANEAAIKVARAYHRARQGGGARAKVIGRHLAYHGFTLATLAAGGMPERSLGFEPLPAGFVRVPPPYCYRCPFGLTYPRCGVACARAVAAAIEGEGPGSVAAVLVEPIQSGAGVFDPPDEYLPMVAEACRRHGVLFMVDEVITGFGRTGRMFGHEWWGVEPDVVTMAKGLASGYAPIGAMAATREVWGAFTVEGARGAGSGLAQVSTFGGHAASAAAALANIDIIEREGLAENATRVGERLKEGLRTLFRHAVVGDVRGRGLLLAVELVADRASRAPLAERLAAEVVERCLEAGVIVGRTAHVASGRGQVLTFAPPLTWSEDEARELVLALDFALSRLGGE